MKESYSTLLQSTQDFCVDAETTSTNALSASSTFLASRINDAIQYLFNLTRNYKSISLPKTMSTVADQIYYHYPPGLLNIETITMDTGQDYPLEVINSQERWDQLHQKDVTSSAIPQYYFPRRDDFGIYPTPDDAYTVTLVGNYLPRRISVADYSTGTVAVTQNDATVTGTDTVFTSAMVGRYFCETDGTVPTGNWYRIASFASTTSIELESVFEETSLSGASYVIVQSPDLPDELHSYIPYHASAAYYSTIRKDPEQAQRLLNYFYTGDFYNTARNGGIKGGVLSVINRYKNTGRNNSQLSKINKINLDPTRSEAWSTTLSEA